MYCLFSMKQSEDVQSTAMRGSGCKLVVVIKTKKLSIPVY